MISLKSEEIRRLSLQNQDYESQVRVYIQMHRQLKRAREELETLKKEGKDTLVAENEQLKADNLTIQKGEG